VPYLTVRYETLVTNPAVVLREIADFIGVEGKALAPFAEELPQLNAVSRVEQEKWRRLNPEAITRILPLIQPMMERLGYESSSS